MRRSICFAGGCFWGMEALYRRLPGVLDVTAGYANGDTADHANYDDVCTGRTGFREAVQVEYEDGTVSLPHLYPSRKRAAADLERSRRSVFLTGGGNSVFHRLTIFV